MFGTWPFRLSQLLQLIASQGETTLAAAWLVSLKEKRDRVVDVP